MHIPEPLQAYEKPTLLAVCDNEHAKFFLLQDRELTEVGEIRIDHAAKTAMTARPASLPAEATLRK